MLEDSEWMTTKRPSVTTVEVFVVITACVFLIDIISELNCSLLCLDTNAVSKAREFFDMCVLGRVHIIAEGYHD